MTCDDGPVLLLAENDLDDRDLTMYALEAAGVEDEVVWLADGVEVLDYLSKRGRFEGRAARPVAALLLDVKMPKLDGFDVLQWVRAHLVFRQLPVVMLASLTDERDVEGCYAMGANAFVVKPVRFEALRDTLRRLAAFWGQWNRWPSREPR